jgi:hypothetical protein
VEWIVGELHIDILSRRWAVRLDRHRPSPNVVYRRSRLCNR